MRLADPLGGVDPRIPTRLRHRSAREFRHNSLDSPEISPLPTAEWCEAYLVGWARDAARGAAIRDVLAGATINEVAASAGFGVRTLRRWVTDARLDLRRAWERRSPLSE